MKQKDIALIIVIAAISASLSFALSHFLFSGDQSRQEKVAVVDSITTDFTTPDPKFFNPQSIDPAKLIEVGNGNNANPFQSAGH